MVCVVPSYIIYVDSTPDIKGTVYNFTADEPPVAGGRPITPEGTDWLVAIDKVETAPDGRPHFFGYRIDVG